MYCYDSAGKLYLKRLIPGMHLMVWHMGPKAYIYGINKNDTYKFVTKYRIGPNEYKYLITNLNRDVRHILDAWEMIDLFNLSPEDPEKEEKKMIKLKLKISDIKPGMIFRAVNPMVTLGIFSGNEYQIERVERDALTSRYRVRLYYAPNDTYRSITDKDFMFIFEVEMDYTDYTVVDSSNPIFALRDSVDIRNAAVRRRSGIYPWGEPKVALGYIYSFKPKKVIFNGPATIVIWKDGTKTIVKRREGETDDKEKAVMYCILKKLCGDKAAMDKYLKLFLKEM